MKGFRSRPSDEPDEPESVARAILGEEPELSAADVAEQTGLSLDDARRLWRALGFPEQGEERAYNRADVAAVSTLVAGVDSGLIDFDLAVTLTRAVGQTMARLADWEVAALVPRVEELEGSDQGTGTRLDTARALLDEFGGPFEELLIYAWRRHLAAAVARIEALGANEEDLSTSQLSVGFADIVSFTALSNEITRERIGDLVELFESRCADVVARNSGRVIKSIGDSVLFVNDDPIRAYDTAEGIISVIGRDKRMPDVRVGLASGSVVMRMGDVFGPPVNMAARLTQVARRNRIIIDAATAR
ncbi:MAG TPA: adenylate/guanylate cyclase domain-containing protein, partial [Nocardioides sp.]|nr:adenylate/guanylate cyclase domain-containing protein [Nocardioides sp.]